MPNYRIYNCTELRKFLTDRQSLNQEASRALLNLSKGRLLYRIQRLDCQPSFTRIMDLPTELRLLVYRDVLVADTSARKPKVYPEILRVSKQVHKEAHPVLYDENEFVLGFAWMQTNLRSRVRALHFGLEMAGKRILHLTTENYIIIVGAATWAALRKAKNLTIDLGLLDEDNREARLAENDSLGGMISLLVLGSESGLKNVTVRLRNEGIYVMCTEDLLRVLWPTTLLPENISFQVLGDLASVTTILAEAQAAGRHKLNVDGHEIVLALRMSHNFHENRFNREWIEARDLERVWSVVDDTKRAAQEMGEFTEYCFRGKPWVQDARARACVSKDRGVVQMGGPC